MSLLAPCFVRLPPAPWITPEKVWSESWFTVKFLPVSVTNPLPLSVLIVVEAGVIPVMSNVSLTVTEVLVEISPLPVNDMVPTETVVAPLYEFEAVRARVPLPIFVSVPELPTAPFNVSVLPPVGTSKVPAPVRVTVLEVAKEAVACRVPPLKVIPASGEVEPRLDSLET